MPTVASWTRFFKTEEWKTLVDAAMGERRVIEAEIMDRLADDEYPSMFRAGIAKGLKRMVLELPRDLVAAQARMEESDRSVEPAETGELDNAY